MLLFKAYDGHDSASFNSRDVAYACANSQQHFLRQCHSNVTIIGLIIIIICFNGNMQTRIQDLLLSVYSA